jgi:hypothetical protein
MGPWSISMPPPPTGGTGESTRPTLRSNHPKPKSELKAYHAQEGLCYGGYRPSRNAESGFETRRHSLQEPKPMGILHHHIGTH